MKFLRAGCPGGAPSARRSPPRKSSGEAYPSIFSQSARAPSCSPISGQGAHEPERADGGCPLLASRPWSVSSVLWRHPHPHNERSLVRARRLVVSHCCSDLMSGAEREEPHPERNRVGLVGALALRRAFALFAAAGQTWRSASSDPRLFAAVWARCRSRATCGRARRTSGASRASRLPRASRRTSRSCARVSRPSWPSARGAGSRNGSGG